MRVSVISDKGPPVAAERLSLLLGGGCHFDALNASSAIDAQYGRTAVRTEDRSMWLIHSVFALVLLSLFLSMFSSGPKLPVAAPAKSENRPPDLSTTPLSRP